MLRWTSVCALVVAIGCGRGSAADTASESALCLPAEFGEYRACGCGCCGGVDSPVVCIEDVDRCIAEIIAEDQVIAQSSGCQYAGCALGTLYVRCAAEH